MSTIFIFTKVGLIGPIFTSGYFSQWSLIFFIENI